jgi:hypothetical protein
MTPRQDPRKDFEERLLARLKAVVAERGAAGAEAPAAGTEMPGIEPASASSPGSPPPGRWRRRSTRLALAAVAAVVIAVAVVVVSSGGGGTSRAYAVEPLDGGGVAIKIYNLAEDPEGLEAALEEAGIPAHVEWLPAQMTCGERHLKSALVKTSMGGGFGGGEMSGPGHGLTIGVMTTAQYRHLSSEFRRQVRSGNEPRGAQPDLPNVSFDPRSFAPGQSVVIVGSPEPHGGDPEGGYRARIEVVEGPVPACEPVPEAAGTIGAIQLPAGAEEDAAATAAGEAAIPAAGQFLYTKTETVQLQTWEPNGPGTGPKDHPRHFTSRVALPGGHRALVPVTKEVWTAPDGTTRVRETLGTIEFLKPSDQKLWEEAGSPPPYEFDPAEHHIKQDAAGDPLKEFSAKNWRGKHAFAVVPKLFRLPTEAAALRNAIEAQPEGSAPQAADSQNGNTTVQRLLEILEEPEASPELAAAAFAALGEIPGIKHEGEATDAAGRSGEALSSEDETGFGRRIIFDPKASKVLSNSEMVLGAPSTKTYGVPAGTVLREKAFLASAIVDSDHATKPAG